MTKEHEAILMLAFPGCPHGRDLKRVRVSKMFYDAIYEGAPKEPNRFAPTYMGVSVVQDPSLSLDEIGWDFKSNLPDGVIRSNEESEKLSREVKLQRELRKIAEDALERRARDYNVAAKEIGDLRTEIQAMASVLLSEFGGPVKDESACEMAVRLLREQGASLTKLRRVLREINERTMGVSP